MRIEARLKVIICLFGLIIFCSGILLAEAAVDPVVLELRYQSGVKFYNRGLHEKAIREFEKVLAMSPDHHEAKEYLARIRSAQESGKLFDSKKSKDATIRELYRDGKKRYSQKDYEGAIEIFNKILELKPVDDFASFHKERCEVLIARRLAKEKKLKEKERIRQERAGQRLARKKEKEARRQEAFEKRTRKDGAVAIREVNALTHEVIEAKREAVQQIQTVQQREEDKLSPRDRRILEKKRAREEKIRAKKEAAQNARQEKLARSQSRKIEKEQAAQEKRSVKELFLEGVKQYGRKQFQEAIASFESVIAAERGGIKNYTNSARRMLVKARRRLEATQER